MSTPVKIESGTITISPTIARDYEARNVFSEIRPDQAINDYGRAGHSYKVSRRTAYATLPAWRGIKVR